MRRNATSRTLLVLIITLISSVAGLWAATSPVSAVDSRAGGSCFGSQLRLVNFGPSEAWADYSGIAGRISIPAGGSVDVPAGRSSVGVWNAATGGIELWSATDAFSAATPVNCPASIGYTLDVEVFRSCTGDTRMVRTTVSSANFLDEPRVGVHGPTGSVTFNALPGEPQHVFVGAELAALGDGTITGDIGEFGAGGQRWPGNVEVITPTQCGSVTAQYACARPATSEGVAVWHIAGFGSAWEVIFGGEFYTNAETQNIEVPVVPALDVGSYPWTVFDSGTLIDAGMFVVTEACGTATGTAMQSTPPARLLETRTGPGLVTVDGLFQGVGQRTAGSVTELQVTGRGGVPSVADAAMLNVTAVFPTGAGYLTAFPCGTTPPTASNVNYGAGQVVPNAVLAKIGTGGKVCIFTLAATDLIVDVNGYVPVGGTPAPLSPGRLLETRTGPGLVTVDGLFQGIGQAAAGSVTELQVTGRGGVPGNAEAAMLNVTAVFPAGAGYLTAFPCGTAPPTASNVNYGAGQVVPNAVLAKIGTGGKVCIFTLAATDLIVDVNGYVPVGGAPSSVVPARVLETRIGPGLVTIDGQFQGIGQRTAGSVTELQVTGRAGVLGTADSVMLNVTAVFPTGAGYLTVFPCGTTPPTASNVNYNAGQVVANAVLAKIGTGGRVCIFTLAATDLIVDVNGFVPGGTTGGG